MQDVKEFLGDLGKKVSETADDVIQKTGEIIDTQKLKSQIRTLERTSERNYVDLGKMVYEKFIDEVTKEEITDEAMIELCKVIGKNNEAVAQCEKDIAARKES